MSIESWPDLDANARYNLYSEMYPDLQAKYPNVKPFGGEVDFTSPYEPVFFVSGVGSVTLDGETKGIRVNITEGTLDYTNTLITAIVVLAAGIIVIRN